MSQNAEYYFQRALENWRTGDKAAALNNLDQAIQLDSEKSEYFLRRGLLKYGHFDQYASAVEDFTKAIQLEPENPRYYLERGSLRYNYFHHYSSALEDFTKVLEYSHNLDDLAIIHGRRAFIYEHLKQIDELLKELDWLIEHGFGTANIYNWRGGYKQKMWQFEAAVKDHTAAYEISPDETTLLRRSQNYYYLMQYDHALRDLNQIIASDRKHSPNYLADVYMLRGSVYYKSGQEDEAFNDFKQAMRLENVNVPDVLQYMENYGLPPERPEKLQIKQE